MKKFDYTRSVGLLLVLVTAACTHVIPPHPEAVKRNALCSEYMQKGFLEQAEENCRIAIEYSPQYHEPYNGLGLIRARQGKMDEAQNFFKQAISAHNNFAEAHNNLGTLFSQASRLDEAADQFKQALEIDPGFNKARLNLAITYYQQRSLPEARKQFVRCTELDPQAAECWHGLGVVATEQGFSEEAEKFYTRETTVAPQEPRGWYNLCVVRIKQSKCSLAVESCLMALAANPEMIEARQNLGEAYKCLALQDKALEKYYEQVRDKPDYAPGHCNLGVAYLEKKLLEKAETELLVCQRLDTKYCFASYRLAKLYDEQNNT